MKYFLRHRRQTIWKTPTEIGFTFTPTSCCPICFFRMKRPSGIFQEWEASKSQNADICLHNSCTQVFKNKHAATMNTESKNIPSSPSLIVFPQNHFHLLFYSLLTWCHHPPVTYCRNLDFGTSLMGQWLRLPAPRAGGPGSIQGWGTRFYVQ